MHVRAVGICLSVASQRSWIKVPTHCHHHALHTQPSPAPSDAPYPPTATASPPPSEKSKYITQACPTRLRATQPGPTAVHAVTPTALCRALPPHQPVAGQQYEGVARLQAVLGHVGGGGHQVQRLLKVRVPKGPAARAGAPQGIKGPLKDLQ